MELPLDLWESIASLLVPCTKIVNAKDRESIQSLMETNAELRTICSKFIKGFYMDQLSDITRFPKYSVMTRLVLDFEDSIIFLMTAVAMRSDRFYSVEKLVLNFLYDRLDAGDHRVILQACPKVRCLTIESGNDYDSFYDLFEKDSHPVREFHCALIGYPPPRITPANLLKFRHIQILKVFEMKDDEVDAVMSLPSLLRIITTGSVSLSRPAKPRTIDHALTFECGDLSFNTAVFLTQSSPSVLISYEYTGGEDAYDWFYGPFEEDVLPEFQDKFIRVIKSLDHFPPIQLWDYEDTILHQWDGLRKLKDVDIPRWDMSLHIVVGYGPGGDVTGSPYICQACKQLKIDMLDEGDDFNHASDTITGFIGHFPHLESVHILCCKSYKYDEVLPLQKEFWKTLGSLPTLKIIKMSGCWKFDWSTWKQLAVFPSLVEIILDKEGRGADDERKVLLGIVMFATLRTQSLANPKSLPTTIRLRVVNPDSIELTNTRDAIRDSTVTLEILM